jgi:hypothetical protein
MIHSFLLHCTDTYETTYFNDAACSDPMKDSESDYAYYYSFYSNPAMLGCERYNNGTSTGYSMKYSCVATSGDSLPVLGTSSQSYFFARFDSNFQFFFLISAF